MATRIGGGRRKTRQKFKKHYKLAGKISLRNYLQEFSEGDKVALRTEPAVQNGMYHRRFHGKIGTIERKNGSCYYVRIKDGDKAKHLIVHPVHLKKMQ